MSRGDDSDVDSSYDELIQDYLENELVPADERTFRSLLGGESFRRRVAQFAMDLGHLHDLARQGMLACQTAECRDGARARRRVVAAVAVAVSVLLALGTAWLLFPTMDRTSPQPIARVVLANGKVVRIDPLTSPQEMDVAAGSDLFSGEILKTVGEDSLAILQFADESVFTIAGGTELKCTVAREQKCIAVSAGDLMAQVNSQPKGKPMVIETPVANAEVRGTRLSLFASGVLTELAVMEGEVRFRRRSDGRSIDLRSGESAVASADSDLVPQLVAPVSSVWGEDFENGLPRYWQAGQLVHESLPSGSLGAVQAVPSRGRQGDPDGPFRIATMREWTRGLFRIEADTHLNFTYKLRFRGGVLVRLNTSTDPLDPSVVDTYEYRNPALGNVPRNHWRTVSVPLSYFHRLHRNHRKGASGQAPEIGDLAIMIGIGSPMRDPGLVVDRIWITRGAPDSAEVLNASPW